MSHLIDSLVDILGRDYVITDSIRRDDISKTTLLFQNIPDVVIYPKTTEEVQKVMRLAQEKNVPVWVVSTGKNWGYGSKTAAYPGGITMILVRMNQIIEVNEALGYAIIEPGVTYAQLNEYLKSKNIKLWMDSAGSTESASVIGNALDKGRGLTSYADHFGALCGMDIVLPSGELMQTGGGPTNNNCSRYLYKWGIGPYIDGLFVQSNLGIVVQAGLWLMPEPEAFDFMVFQYKANEDRLPNFVDDLRQLVSRGFLPSRPHFANDYAMLCIVSQYPHHLLTKGRTHLSREALLQWRKSFGITSWTCGLGLYGSKTEVRLQKRMLKKVLGKYGRLQSFGIALRKDWVGRLAFWIAKKVARFMGISDEMVEQAVPAANLFKGIPTDQFAKQVYFKNYEAKPKGEIDPPKDGCGFIWIGPVIPFSSDDIQRIMDTTKIIFEKHGFEYFVELIIEGPRSIIFLMGIFYDKKNKEECERAEAWYFEIRQLCLEMGYPPYRETTQSTTKALDTNPEMKKLIGQIKMAVDPLNILAPGRYGTPLREDSKCNAVGND